MHRVVLRFRFFHVVHFVFGFWFLVFGFWFLVFGFQRSLALVRTLGDLGRYVAKNTYAQR